MRDAATSPMPCIRGASPFLWTESKTTQPIRLAKVSDRPRRIGDWAETQTARDITRSLEMVTVIDGPGFTMIAGGPGTGKTTAVPGPPASGIAPSNNRNPVSQPPSCRDAAPARAPGSATGIALVASLVAS